MKFVLTCRNGLTDFCETHTFDDLPTLQVNLNLYAENRWKPRRLLVDSNEIVRLVSPDGCQSATVTLEN